MENFHEWLGRIGPFASIDVLLTILAAPIFGLSLPVMFAMGVVTHKALGIDTPLNRVIFPRKKTQAGGA